MTVADIITAAAHEGRIPDVTIRAASPADVAEQFAKLRAIAPDAYVQAPAWHDNGFSGPPTSRWYSGVIHVEGVYVSISTEHEPVMARRSAVGL
jgi:hypothetical protein